MVWFVQIRTANERGKAPFYENTDASSFLKDDGPNQLFISGLKGVGKTLLLGHKSAELRRTSDGVLFVPQNDLTEAFTSTPFSLNVQTRDKLSSWRSWQIVWRTALAVVVLRRAGVKLPDEVRDLFVDCAESLSVMAHVRVLIFGDLARDIDTRLPRLSGQLEALLGPVQNGVYVFLDAIDELVVAHTGELLRRYASERATQFGHLSADVWAAAQIGFVRAALDIHNNHKHIRIYGAIRSEAIEHYKASDLQNIEPRILRISYSSTDLKRMFTQKLEQLHELSPSLFVASGNNLLSRFLGFDTFVHPTVRTPRREPLREDLLDYVLRHTRGRPRELDELGKAIETIAVQERCERTVRERVRIRSGDFFNWATAEAIPYWKPQYDVLIQAFQSNWITRNDLARLIRKLGIEEFGDSHRGLFKAGLLGCTTRRLGGDGLELRFRQFDYMAPIDLTDFEVADQYALHPCVNIATFPLKRDRYQPDPWNVVAHGHRYVEARRHGHVHIGAGALGLGCAVPLLMADSGLGVCVMQRPSARWSGLCLKSGQTVKLDVRYQTTDAMGRSEPVSLEFTGIDETTKVGKIREFVSDWTKGERHLFYLGQLDHQHAQTILSNAESVSTAIRGQNLQELAAPLTSALAKGVRIYPFENDDEAVRRFAEAMRSNGNDVVEVVVDRICQSVGLQPKTLIVGVEAYQKIIFLDNTEKSKELFCPPASNTARDVSVISDPRAFAFMRTRKRVLVNGLHFFFALGSYALMRKSSIDPNAVATTPTTTLFIRTLEVRDLLEVCNRLLKLSLLAEAENIGLARSNADILALAKDIDIQQQQVMDRLLSMPDSLMRILNSEDGRALNAKAGIFLLRISSLREALPRARLTKANAPPHELDGVEDDIAMLEKLFLYEVYKAQKPN